jgi:hypothetical protein
VPFADLHFATSKDDYSILSPQCYCGRVHRHFSDVLTQLCFSFVVLAAEIAMAVDFVACCLAAMVRHNYDHFSLTAREHFWLF